VLAIDRSLRLALSEVDEAVDAHLQERSDETRRDLAAALERLDKQVGDADAFAFRPRGGRLGTIPLPGVIGATGYSPVTVEVGSDEFRAEVALTHVAKDEVRAPDADTFRALGQAAEELASARGDAAV
jgi:hypothetical protein